jgi:iron-sulfur cluster insertion protein
MEIKQFVPQKIRLSDKAFSKIQELKKDKENANKCFRVFITGGGCSGFQYGFVFDDKSEDDIAIRIKEVDIIIDSLSMQYIIHSTIEHKQDLMGSKFVVINPNAKTTCSCNLSFSV